MVVVFSRMCPKNTRRERDRGSLIYTTQRYKVLLLHKSNGYYIATCQTVIFQNRRQRRLVFFSPTIKVRRESDPEWRWLRRSINPLYFLIGRIVINNQGCTTNPTLVLFVPNNAFAA